ncbi:MAG: MBL fold metallo-hydrolase [Bacteroidales bacterium]|nr:MBL fold metallo-hydrolase [Bacteroidales bacterium]
MKLFSIETGNFKLDGGAMFGVVPKVLWNKIYPADENNQCDWAMRCLLVDDGNHKILIDTGVGDKQDEKFLKNFGLFGDDTMIGSLAKHGYKPEDITDVVHTHLHFDHAGGTIKYDQNKKLVPTFPNATLWVGKEHWNEATNANERERASFLKENILPMQESGKLKLIDEECELFPNFHVKFFYGHTIGQLIPHINFNGKWIVYGADLFPSSAHIYEPYIMGYDMNARQTLADKKRFFAEAHEHNYTIFFEHDIYNECATLLKTERGTKVKETFSLQDFISQSR